MPHPSSFALQYPERPAYVMAESGERITYRELNQRSNQIAHLLRNSKLRSGDHIAVFMENRKEFVQIIWGAQRSGLVFTTISTHLKADELAYILLDSQCKIIFTSAILKPVVSAAIASHTELAECGVIDIDDSFYAALNTLPDSEISDESAGCELLYSSGTTGRPKGVEVANSATSIDSMLPVLHGLKKLFGFSSDTVYLSPAPLYHAAPLRFVMLTMFEGGTAVIMKKFDAVLALKAIEQYRVTHSQWVPIMFLRLLEVDAAISRSVDVSSMTVAIHAAAPCPVEVKQQMLDWWGATIYEYYGSTEAIGLTVIGPEEWREKTGSVGRAVVGSLRIVNEQIGELCPAGQIGDIYFADGPGVTYRNDPEKTAAVCNDQGWYTCGDVGYIDEDGYLFLSDRRDFMIISGGVNIYPQETENTLVLHPAVADVAVFGIANKEFGQEVKAVVQLHDPDNANAQTAQSLMDFCREKLSAIKCPKSIDFMAALPRMENGKLYKKQLLKHYQ